MTVLTWRDVAAPDFRGVQDGIRNASELLNSALGSAREGLTRIDNNRTDNANNALLADLAGLQNADAAQSFLGSLSGRPDLARISGETLKFAMGRPDDLIKTAGSESDLAFTDWTRGNVKESHAAQKAAAPTLQKAGLLANAGRYDEAQQLIAANMDQLEGLTADQFFASMKDLQSGTQGDTSVRSGRWNFNNNVRDDEESRQATALQGVIRMSGVEPADFDAFVTSNYQSLIDKGISPVVIERARHAVLNDPTAAAAFYESGTLGGGGGDLSGSGGGAGGDPTRVITGGGKGNLGIGALPADVQTLGQAVQFGKSLNNRGQESSAMGLYQITQSTMEEFAPKVLGANWASQSFSAANQDAVAKAIFESTGRDPQKLMGRWTSLSPAEAQQVARMPWEQAREVIAKGESGASNISAIIAQKAQDVVGQAGPIYNRSQDQGQVLARQMLDAMGSDANARQVAMNLVGKEGILPGENLGNVTGVIKRISQQYKISEAAAGVVLSRSVDQNKNWYQRLGDKVSGIVGGGDGLESHIDWDQVEQLAGQAGNRDALLKQVAASTVNDASAALVASSSAAASQAQQIAARRQAAAQRLGRNVTTTNAAAAIGQAANAAATRDGALANAGAVTAAGGRQNPTPPKVDQKNVAQPPKSKPAPAKVEDRPGVKELSAALANVRSTAKVVKSQGIGTSGLEAIRNRGNYNRAVNASVELAIKSGIPQFKRKPGELEPVYRERIKNMLVRK